MPTCFVIQPFDSGKYDKRFDQVFKPAILEAGLQPYRVDQDIRANVPIESIERGIQEAAICLAEITTDNPNVWYELGYAFAARKQVLMVCSQERESGKYPFDIRHRSVLRYSSEAPNDFKTLQNQVAVRLAALSENGEHFQKVASSNNIMSVAGLSPSELLVVTAIAKAVPTDEGKVGIWAARQNAEAEGLSPVHFTLGLRRLKHRGFVQMTEDEDYNGNRFDTFSLTDAAWNWIGDNEEMFPLKRESNAAHVDDLPF